MEELWEEVEVPVKQSAKIDRLRKWRQAALILNAQRRFEYQLDLKRRQALEIFKLEDILSATNNFSDENLIKKGALGNAYKGQLLRDENLISFVVQRLDCDYVHGDDLQKEISKITRLRNNNIASVYGYCDENNEKILIYKAFYGTLNQHVSETTFTWYQRLEVCIGVARGLNHVHYDVIHCDINSSKIILDEYWEPKIYGFELSTEYPQSWMHRVRFSRYFDTNNLTPKYDVYSFGVLLLEVLCGRKPKVTKDGVEEDLDEIMDPNLRKQMDTLSMTIFTRIAYKCLDQDNVQRPTMDQIVKELEEALELQWKHDNQNTMEEHSKAADEGTSSNSLKISLTEIRLATNGFNKTCLVGSGGYAHVYRAKLDFLNIEGVSSMEGKSKDQLPKISKTVAIKRIFNGGDEKGKQGFLTEIELLTSCKHPNIVSLLGFSKEADEMILVFEYAFKGSLGDYLTTSDKTTVSLTWAQRIQICLDIARGIDYLHTDMEGKPRIIHRDIKSDNILLDENMNAKLADFGLSKAHPINQQASTIQTNMLAGTMLYMDPEYLATGKYKRESDIYSFGVVLFEVLSGRVAYDSIYTNENDLGLAPIARRRFNEGTLKEMIDPKIIEEDVDHIFTLNRGPNQDSFHTFSKIAYQCLAETQAKRPTIKVVINELQNALKLQEETTVLSMFRLSDIMLCTENFAETSCIGLDTNGMIYKAEVDHFGYNSSMATKGENNRELLKKRITVAIKRISDNKGGLGKQGFFEELEMRAYKHPNIVSLLGFCDENDERILVYEHVSEITLDDYLKSSNNTDSFTWTQRLQMCLEIARGLKHLHAKITNPQRIIHIDIKSANIILDKNRGAKIGYFVIPKLHPTDQEIRMKVYEDPEYETTGKREKESDIYSFGVVLFEILCGRVAYDPIYIMDNEKGLPPIARQCYNDETIERIIDPRLMEEMGKDAFTSNKRANAFLKMACECLGEADKRPTTEMVIIVLETIIQLSRPKPHGI